MRRRDWTRRLKKMEVEPLVAHVNMRRRGRQEQGVEKALEETVSVSLVRGG